MTSLLPTFRALLESLDGLGLAKKPTTQQVQSVCSAFVEMVAGLTGEKCAIAIGQTVIAREHEEHRRAVRQI